MSDIRVHRGETIWKFTFRIDENVRIEMPFDARVLRVDKQGDKFQAWAACDAARPNVLRAFFIVGTGSLVPRAGTFVATVFDGPFVWHMFEDDK